MTKPKAKRRMSLVRSSSAGNEVITGDDEDRLIEHTERLFSEFLIVGEDKQTQAQAEAG